MVFKPDQLISISDMLTHALQNQPYYIDKLETEKDRLIMNSKERQQQKQDQNVAQQQFLVIYLIRTIRLDCQCREEASIGLFLILQY